MAVAFDTLAFSERSRAGGFSEEQAKAATEAFAHATSQELVTTADLERFEHRLEPRFTALETAIGELDQRLTGQIGELDQRMQFEFKTVRQDINTLQMQLTIRMGLIMAAGIAIVSTMVTLS